MRAVVLVLLAAGCAGKAVDDTGAGGGEGAGPSVEIGEWYAVSPSFPMPDGPIAEQCVPPHCEMAIRLEGNGDLVYSESGEGLTVRGTWETTADVTVDGHTADVVLLDAGHPSFVLDYGPGEVRITAWPYDDPPHEREPGTY